MKRAVIRSNFCGAMQSKARSGCHVATSPRRDVTKSRRRVNNAEVNNSATSRRDHVATSPRRDVTTSRRGDVSSKICISSFNVRTTRKMGASGGVRGKAQNSRADRDRLRGSARDLYRFSFVRYYIGYFDDVFNTRHFDLFFHDVLDLFLGLHQTLSHTMD